MSGDESVILVPDVEPEALDENIRRFRDAVERTARLMGYFGLSTSIGAVAFVPTESDLGAGTVLAEADRRMYANKRRRRAPGFDAPEITMKLPIGPAELFAGEGVAALSIN